VSRRIALLEQKISYDAVMRNKNSVIARVVTGLSIFAAIVLSASCQTKRELKPGASEKSDISGKAPSAPAQTGREAGIPERWFGKWDGPEGTFLQVTKSADKYQVTIQNLDGPRTFDASPAGDRLQFTRDGQTETIHEGNGQDAGMKWLLDKKDCLVIKKGEGFCRD
jgi:hypothetical protein